ncbi:hypothetical protein TVAG_238670 [Trichomonas vaginalis G3]|uniref:Ankyrin repeat protein n=1 Tax=Trichomonas vaginalis (strain ATCC PRA-98 / G3) TaxID=412133 RepID=A2DG99_TRIV3|nr:hypothetical protein TVAG_238670 [Trichomonas vaginalis G3]|eukprot:XP_001581481.1 hypothetical protein [Trichomonas vaginalis G3]
MFPFEHIEKDKYGCTALHHATHNNKETDELLISYGANINGKVIQGFTALIFTGIFFHLKMINSKVLKGALTTF